MALLYVKRFHMSIVTILIFAQNIWVIFGSFAQNSFYFVRSNIFLGIKKGRVVFSLPFLFSVMLSVLPVILLEDPCSFLLFFLRSDRSAYPPLPLQSV